MNRLFLIFIVLSVLSLSCEKTSSESITIALSADKYGVFSDGVDFITFSTTLADRTSITGETEFYVDGVKITGNTFSSTTKGEYEVYASYKDVKSETITIGIVEKVEAPENYTTKILVEDFTGTWCGWCPRVAYKLEEAVKANANIIPVGIHQGDNMQYLYVNQLIDKYSISGFPTGLLNRASKWDENQSGLDNLLANPVKLGLAISSVQNGNDLDVNVKIGFKENISTELKLIVYLTQDGFIEDQNNYMNEDNSSPWYNTGNPIVGYEHNHVLKRALTDIFGDDIPQYVTLARNTYSVNLSINASSLDVSKLHVVAFVVKSKDSANMYNVQTAKAGATVDFD